MMMMVTDFAISIVLQRLTAIQEADDTTSSDSSSSSSSRVKPPTRSLSLLPLPYLLSLYLSHT